MRLYELTREQQRAFMVLARQVVAADDRLAMSEVEGLDLLYREMELPAADAGEPGDALDLNYLFDTPRARAVVLLNLLLLAHTDGAGQEEREVIHRTADRLDVEPEALAAMEAWADRYMALVGEVDGFYGHEEGADEG